jgi:hypothetical protein
VLIGLGYACLSLTGLTAAIGPWFERHQGRSTAIALMGASIGGMIVVPLLVVSVDRFGFTPTISGSSLLTAAVLLPLVAVVLCYRGPSELRLVLDRGALPRVSHPAAVPRWTRREAMATTAFWTTALAFALGLAAQVGYFTHQLNLARPVLGTEGAGRLAGATGFANLLGRLLLARIVDEMPVRRYSATIFGAQAVALIALAFAGGTAVLIVTSLIYGFCLGQITTLSPIVVRREFGAASFGAIYGIAATVIQFTSAFGPGIYRVLHDVLGGYALVMATAGRCLSCLRPAVPRTNLAVGDIVIADNRASHKVAGVRQAIEARGASSWFLPPYSPDLNPIEQAFAKLKQFVRSAAPRTRERLWNTLAPLSVTSHKPNARTSSPMQAIHTQRESALALQL